MRPRLVENKTVEPHDKAGSWNKRGGSRDMQFQLIVRLFVGILTNLNRIYDLMRQLAITLLLNGDSCIY